MVLHTSAFCSSQPDFLLSLTLYHCSANVTQKLVRQIIHFFLLCLFFHGMPQNSLFVFVIIRIHFVVIRIRFVPIFSTTSTYMVFSQSFSKIPFVLPRVSLLCEKRLFLFSLIYYKSTYYLQQPRNAIEIYLTDFPLVI